MRAKVIRVRQRAQRGRSIAVSMTCVKHPLGIILLMPFQGSRSTPIPRLPQCTTG